MKHFLSILTILYSFSLKAQAPDYQDLIILYADGKYEKLVDKAEKYTFKEDTKKDPQPYIFLAKAYFKISASGDAPIEFKNAFKDAMSAFGKAQKCDTGGYAANLHSEFVKEFTLNIAERIINDAEAQDFKKAYGLNVKYNKIAKNLGGTLYMDGACKFRNADKSGANTAWKEAEKAMEGIQSLDDWWDADKNLLRVGVIETARTYIDMRQVEKATDLLEKYKSFFEGDKDFEAAYTELTK